MSSGEHRSRTPHEPELGRPSYIAVAVFAIALLVLGSNLLSGKHDVWGVLSFAAIAAVIGAATRR